MEILKEEKQLYTVMEIADKLKVSKTTVYAIKNLPFVRVGKHRRYILDEVINHLKTSTK